MEEKLNKTRSTCWTYKKWKFASLLINFVLCLTIKYIVFVCHGIVRWCSQKVLSCNKLRFHWEMSKHSACVCKCQGETYRLCDDFYHYSLLAKSIRNTSVHTEWSNFHQIIHHCCKKCPFIDSLFPCFTRHSDPVKRSKQIVVTRVPLSIASLLTRLLTPMDKLISYFLALFSQGEVVLERHQALVIVWIDIGKTRKDAVRRICLRRSRRKNIATVECVLPGPV